MVAARRSEWLREAGAWGPAEIVGLPRIDRFSRPYRTPMHLRIDDPGLKPFALVPGPFRAARIVVGGVYYCGI